VSIGPLKKRSSWPSSFVTGLIGWNGFFIILALILGDVNSAGKIFIVASCIAVVQVLVLRLLFFTLRLDRSMWAGAIWGAITAAIGAIVAMRITELFDSHPVIWLLNAVYIGIAVGLFLVYFHRDDRRIESEAAEKSVPIDYGRDANWLEPFFFGAVAYVIAFLPTSFDLAVIVVVIGSVSGVVAAGVSHFFVFTVARRSVWPVVLSVAAGAVQGAFSGLLLRQFAVTLFLSPLVHGAIAGSLTYLMTAVRGRSLAAQELAVDTN